MALSPRERNMVIFLVLIAAGAGAFFLLSGGGGEPEDAAPPLVVPTGAAESPTPIAPSPSPGLRRPPPPLAIVTGRDPFVPLVVAEAGAGATGTAPAEVGEPQPPVEEPGPGAEREELPGVTIGGRQVTLVEVVERRGEQAARVEVDGETYTVTEGERFAGNFRVVSIEGECVTLLFGDETFRVCVPEQGK